MTHDIDDLLELIYKLELRIIDLETMLGTNPRLTQRQMIEEDVNDRWYFDY